MYTKKSYTLFGHSVVYFKNGLSIARRDDDGPLTLKTPAYKFREPVCMTRAQGYRYWTKHFNHLPYYCLPALLEAAVCLDPHEEREVCVMQYADGRIDKGWRV